MTTHSLQRYAPYLQLMRLDRPVGSLLLLWPTLAALWMAAAQTPSWQLIVIFSLGTVLMRSAGCVINDYADRHVDGQVRRTAQRPLATGAVSERAALLLFAGLVVAAGLLVLFLNRTTLWLAPGGLAIAALYPFMKRWTHLPQVVLGAAFSWGILMAFSATNNTVDSTAGLMFVGSLMWIVAYDTMYAMVDRRDDLQAGVKSTAILFGQHDRLMIGVLQGGAWWAFWLVGNKLNYQLAYYIGLVACAGLFLYQQWLIRRRDEACCFAAFRNNTWVGFSLFAGTVAELTLQSNGA